MMKRLTLAVVLIFLAFPATVPLAADDACPEAIIEARDLIAQADAALTEERYTDAKTLLRDARQRINIGCSDAADTPSIAPVTSATGSISGNSNLNADSQITPPDVDPNGNVAYIRVLNTVADIDSPIDITLDGFGVMVNNLHYGEFSGLIPVPSGSLNFNGLGWDFPANSTWVVMNVGLDETVSIALEPISVLRNDLQGKARVRVVQAISGTDYLTVSSADGTDFGSALGWLGIRDIDLEPGDYTLRADKPDGAAFVPDTDFTFEANQNYTIFIIGGKTGTPAPQFVSLISPQDVTRVQFTNNNAAAVDVHYRPGNSKIVDALAPGATSDWIEIPSGAVTFISYVPGTGPTGQEQAALYESLKSGRDISVLIRQNGNMTVENVAFTE